MGTHVIINGQEYVAQDKGGAIKGNRIDIYMKDHDDAKKAGRFTAQVYKVAYEGEGGPEAEEWSGWNEGNIMWCKTIYNQNWSEIYVGISDYGGFIENGELVVEGDFVWPVTNTTTSSGYGWRIHPITNLRTFHKGRDRRKFCVIDEPRQYENLRLSQE